MQEIIFATSNSGKVKSLERRLEGMSYKVIQENLDIPEIQAESAREVALYKAQYVYKKLGKPIVVQDSSFHIHALKGFPGPYIKYVNQTIGPYGLIKLMEGVEDRSCHFEIALVFVDKAGESHVFVNSGAPGLLAKKVYEGESKESWSSLWKIYVSPTYGKTLAEFSSEELKEKETSKNDKSEFAQFIKWLKEQK